MAVPSREEIEQVIEKRIRPLLAVDRGDIAVEEIREDGTVVVLLQGRCGGCPGATYTISALVEPFLTKNVPGVTRVIAAQWRYKK